LTVEIGQPQALSAGQLSRPQADLQYVPTDPVVAVGQDIYVAMFNPGPDQLLNNTIQVTTYWIDPNTSQAVNTQTAFHAINAGSDPMWLVRVDSIPPVYANLDPLPQFHVEWSPVDFDATGTSSKVYQGVPAAF